MRKIKSVGRFDKDLNRVYGGRYGAELDNLLASALPPLANDLALPQKFHDHALKGKWRGYRECHLKPDLLLIYRKPNNNTLELVRLGSHSELGLG